MPCNENNRPTPAKDARVPALAALVGILSVIGLIFYGSSDISDQSISLYPTGAHEPGRYTFITASGVAGVSTPQAVASGSNTSPTLDKIPDQEVAESTLLSFTARVSNADTPNAITYGLVGAPSGAEINPNNGTFVWRPTSEQVGTHQVIVVISDGMGGFDLQEVVIRVHADTAIASLPIVDTFDRNLDGWWFHEEPNVGANNQHCRTQNTAVYSLTHSPEHGGSAFTEYSDACWFGSAGGAKTFTIPAESDGQEIFFSLDYRSLTPGIDPGSGHVNNILYAVSDSAGNLVQSSTIYRGERNSGLRDTGWQSYTTIIPSLRSEQCPCTIFVFTHDDWAAVEIQSIYFDNVIISPTISTRPILNPIGSHVVNKHETLRLDVAAMVKGDHAAPLTYLLVDPPSGAAIDPDSGVLTWMPTSDQVGIHQIIVAVSDSAGDFDLEEATITVSSPLPIRDTFDEDLDGWHLLEVADTLRIDHGCQVQNTDVYSLSHSSVHNGSAFVDDSNACWFGSVGGVKTFTIPSQNGEQHLLFSLDYRSLALYIPSTGWGHVNNIHYAVADSSGNPIQTDVIYRGEEGSGLRDTGWLSYATIIPPVSPIQCPCTISVFITDEWVAGWGNSIYFDNVIITPVALAQGPIQD